MAENKFEFRYKLGEVTSAQRMRMLKSGQFKYLIGIGLFGMMAMAVPLIVPQWFPVGKTYSWPLVIEIAVAYIVTFAVLLFITPVMDFYFNRVWRLPLMLQFNEKQLRVSVPGGKSAGLRLPWGEIHRVDETGRVFILYYGAGNKYIILPKGMFTRPQDDRRFRDLLKRRASLPAELSTEDDAK